MDSRKDSTRDDDKNDVNDDDDFSVPESMKAFATKLLRHLNGRNVFDLQNLYESDYNELTERYFKASPLPETKLIAPLVENDQNFLLLYKELYFRHLHAKLDVTLSDRLESFKNYTELFNMILGLNTEEPELELPTSWIWEMVDEFIYQFQTFHHYRSKVSALSDSDKQELKQHGHAWSPQAVIRYLHALAKKASADPRSKSAAAEDDSEEKKDGAPKVASLFRVFHQFSLVGLLRVNCLIGDYASALQAVEPLDWRAKRSVLLSVSACYSTIYYFMGFAQLMTRRYVEAAKTFSSFIREASRNKFNSARNYQQQAISKRLEQMHGLLAIAVNLAPHRLEEQVHSALKEKFQEQLQRMQKGEVEVFIELFEKSCPKFVTLSVPNYDTKEEAPREGHNLQLKLFRQEVEQRQKLSEIYSFLKLCTAVDVPKLATFLGSGHDEDAALTLLMCLKHKNRSLRAGAAGANADFTGSAEIEFYLSKDVVHVAEYRAPRRFGEFFIKNILRLEDMLDDIRSDRKENKAR